MLNAYAVPGTKKYPTNRNSITITFSEPIGIYSFYSFVVFEFLPIGKSFGPKKKRCFFFLNKTETSARRPRGQQSLLH